MPQSTIDIARGGPAATVTRCAVLGEGANVRLAFLEGDGEQTSLLSAVTLTRGQLTGFAGMVSAVLDAKDPNATSVN